MPNLVGIWNAGASRETLTSVLRKQLARVRVPSVVYKEYSFAEADFAAGLQDHGILENGEMPVRSDDDRYVMFLDGELYNAEELSERYAKDIPNSGGKSPAKICLDLISRFGKKIAIEFNGLFVMVLFDRVNRSLTIIPDRYGFRPLFYKYANGKLLFATELKGIAAADESPCAIDRTALVEQYVYGTHFKERCWINGYIRTRPGEILEADAKGIRSETYWFYDYDEKAPRLDQITYSTRFAVLLDRATERCMRGSHRIGMFLSGGYDSRSVAASIRPHHLPLPAFTFGHPESRDVRFAAMLAERIGMKFFPLQQSGKYLYPNVHAIVWRTEGLLPFANLTSVRYHSIFKEHMDIFLTGFLGEFGGSHTWPQLLLSRSRKAAVDAIFERFVTARLGIAKRIFQPAVFATAYEELVARFHVTMEDDPNDHPMDLADAWNFRNIQPFCTSLSPMIDRYNFDVRAPHMDNDLLDFLLTIRPADRIEQRVYKRMIATAYPNIRDVPCTNNARPIDPNFAREYARMTVEFAGRKAKSLVNRVTGKAEGLGREFRNVDDDFRAEPELVDQILNPLLNAGVFPAEIFNVDQVRAIVDEHYHRGRNHEAVLSKLIAWGLAATFFMRGDDRAFPDSLRERAVAVGS